MMSIYIDESREDLWCQEMLGLYLDLVEGGGGGPEAQRADQGIEAWGQASLVSWEGC